MENIFLLGSLVPVRTKNFIPVKAKIRMHFCQKNNITKIYFTLFYLELIVLLSDQLNSVTTKRRMIGRE
jgi:hypothetical protein